jgi:hypothetical protein
MGVCMMILAVVAAMVTCGPPPHIRLTPNRGLCNRDPFELGQFHGKSVVIQCRLRSLGADLSVQFHPGLAPAIDRQHRQLDSLRQPKDADGQRVNLFGPPPLETPGNDVVAPNVLASQPFRGGEGLQPPPGGDAREVIDPEDIAGETRGQFIKSLPGFGQDRIALLMKQSWKKKKLGMLDLEAANPFAQAAFAQNDNLFAAAQGINDNRPLFECQSHEKESHVIAERRLAQERLLVTAQVGRKTEFFG